MLDAKRSASLRASCRSMAGISSRSFGARYFQQLLIFAPFPVVGIMNSLRALTERRCRI